ncbi:IclR family transcriptional regulator [Brevibacterium album]|uniref:IclR family transcriptional regulator n=1 Tax=Brevibacterium album TaxID=417948 RepID=UPI0004183B17|nr:helix-turn-helix domain-containing protein [Brevibacterium album]
MPADGSAPRNGSTPKGGLGTIRNATVLMDLLAQPPHLHQLSDLAQRSGMTVPTVHRLLRSLVHAEYAEQDPATSRYGLGRAITRLAVRQLSNSPVLSALNPFLASLRDELSATIAVHVLISGEAVCIDQVDAADRGPFRRPLRAVPALSTAAGRLLAAHQPDEAWNRILTGSGTEDEAEAQSHREDWRRSDHLTHSSADPGASDEVAVPVRAADGSVVAALSADLRPDADLARIVSLLTRTAASGGRSIAHA